MAYTKQTWADLPSKTTPINAERLTHIEDGIFNAAQTADTAASTAGTAAANVGIVSGKVETLTERVNGLDTAVSNKVDKVAGKDLSTNDYTNTDKAKVDALGTASTKNSTSVVTQSTDLVESGAVKDIVGWGNKNKYNFDISDVGANIITTANISYSDGVLSCQSTGAVSSGMYLKPTSLKGKFADLANIPCIFSCKAKSSVACNGAILSDTIIAMPTEWTEFTFEVSDPSNIGALVFYNKDASKTPIIYVKDMMLEVGSTATAYEPYHASVEESIPQVVSDAVGWDGGNLIGTIEQGGFDNSGLNVSSNQRVRNKEYIPVKGGAQYIISGTVNNGILQGSVSFYTVNDYTTPRIDYILWLDTPAKFTVPSNAKYMRVLFKRKADADLTPSDINNGALIHSTVDEQKCDNTVIAPVENGSTASQAYAVGEHFIRDGAFCTCKQAISQGGSFTLGTNYTAGDVADSLVYKAGDSIDVGDGTFPTMYNGIFFTNLSLRFVIRVDKKIIANNVAISNSGIGICNADGTVASVLNLTANYNITILNIKNNDIQVQMSKKDGTAFSVTDGSTAVVRFYGTLTFS